MNTTLTNSHPNYREIVTVENPESYTVDITKLENDQGVECPFGNDMVIGKSPTGEIIIQKKCYLPPFSTSPKFRNR